MVCTGQGASKPYSYRGTAYRRIGNITLAMSVDEYNRMFFERMHSEQRWENQPATGWSIDDLDSIDRKIDLLRRKRAVLEELFRTLLHKLMTGERRVGDLTDVGVRNITQCVRDSCSKPLIET